MASTGLRSVALGTLALAHIERSQCLRTNTPCRPDQGASGQRFLPLQLPTHANSILGPRRPAHPAWRNFPLQLDVESDQAIPAS